MVRLGIVGTGGMAEYQAKKFSSVPGCVIAACKDHKEDHAAEFCRRFGIPRWFPTAEGLLDSGLCDALTCVVIDSRHRAICDAALERRLPIFCEKPLARSLSDCAALAAAAAVAGVPNLVNFSKRNAGALWALKDAVDSDRLGEIRGVEAAYTQGWVATKVWGDWRQVPRWRWRLLPAVGTAGIVGDLGTHLADALLLLFGGLEPSGRPPEVATLSQAMASGLADQTPLEEDFFQDGRTVPVAFSVAAVLPNGAPVRISADWTDPTATDDFRIRLRGSRSDALLDLRRSRDTVELLPHGGPAETLAAEPVESTYDNFIRRAAGRLSRQDDHGADTRPQADFAHALHVQETLDRLLPGVMPQ